MTSFILNYRMKLEQKTFRPNFDAIYFERRKKFYGSQVHKLKDEHFLK